MILNKILIYCRKVFSKLGFEINDDVITELICSKSGCIERFLMLLRQKLNDIKYEMERAKQRQKMQQTGFRKESDQPEADQYIHMGKNRIRWRYI